jgi:hypothetical protein
MDFRELAENHTEALFGGADPRLMGDLSEKDQSFELGAAGVRQPDAVHV